MSDTTEALITDTLRPLRWEWRSPSQEQDAANARRLSARNTDDYWAWVAAQQRWLRPWHTVRQGGLGDFRYFLEGQLNVSDNCLDRWAENLGTADKTALIWEGEPGDTRSFTFSELRDEVGRLAAGLRSRGVQQGDVVGLYVPNLVEAFVGIHACYRIGALYTVLFAGFGEDAVASRLAASGATVVLVPDASFRRGRLIPLLATLRSARTRLPALRDVLVVDRTGRNIPLEEGEVWYHDVVASQLELAPPLPLDANDPGFLIFTSGTEARPKGLVHAGGGFLLGTWANVKWQIGPEPDDVYWVAADVGWLTFPIQAVVGALAHGMTVVAYEGAMDTPSPSRFYDICERHRVTKLLTAPTTLRLLRGHGAELAAQHPLPRLRLVSVQGEPLDRETFDWASTELALGVGGVPVVNAYGQTETGSTWSYPICGVDDLKAGSCGRPVPGHSAEVVDEQGHPVPPGTKGELVLTAPFPTLARTVWQDADRYRAAYLSRHPGRYATSDEAVIDADGHLWVLGRVDDVINVAAHRLSTMEIEAALTGHPCVVEAAVVGVPDSVKGTVPVGFVSLRATASANTVLPELHERVAREIGGIARLGDIFVVPSMPKTRTGKIVRRLLREIVQHGTVRGDTSALEDVDSVVAVATVVTRHRKPPA